MQVPTSEGVEMDEDDEENGGDDFEGKAGARGQISLLDEDGEWGKVRKQVQGGYYFRLTHIILVHREQAKIPSICVLGTKRRGERGL